MRRFFLLVLFSLTAACSGASKPLDAPPMADGLAAPEPLAWWSRAAIDAYIRFSSWRGERSGYIVLLARDGVPVYANAAGWKNIEARTPMTLDTEVRIASMTKPVTAVAAMLLVEQGLLGLDDPVAEYLPAFARLRVATSQTAGADGSFASRPAATPMTVRHLLMFASGIGPGMGESTDLTSLWEARGIHGQADGDLRQRVDRLAALPLFEEPGTRWRYGASADVLAAVVQQVSGRNIGDFMQERIFEPLGMAHTRFEPPVAERGNMATVYRQDSNGDLVEADIHYAPDWQPGGGGLVSTVSDYMRFALMLYNGGEYRGVRILQQATVDEMRRVHVPEGVLAEQGIAGVGWGLGMAVVSNAEASRTPDRNGDFWWSGFYGTQFFVSPETGLVGVIMTQNKPGEFSGINYQPYIVQGLALAGL
ncbi:MAG: beta-lactamase family protein [Halioglobus sp.]|nr:beta-lactamase family protein [Halioglobus sp.]